MESERTYTFVVSPEEKWHLVTYNYATKEFDLESALDDKGVAVMLTEGVAPSWEAAAMMCELFLQDRTRLQKEN